MAGCVPDLIIGHLEFDICKCRFGEISCEQCIWALGFGLWALGFGLWAWAALARPVRKASGFPFAPLETMRLRLGRLSRQKSHRLAGKPEASRTGRGKAAELPL